MQGIIGRFLTFDKLIGPLLVKFLYYVGLGFIVLALVVALGGALFSIMRAPLQAAVTLFIAPLAAAVAVVYWRFVCELFLLAFNTFERLGEIRDRLPAPEYPKF